MVDIADDFEYLGSQFALEIKGIDLGRFKDCSGLTLTTEVVEYQAVENGRPVIKKRPGRTKVEDVVFKRGFSPGTELTEWHKKVQDGKVERKDGSIVIYDSTGLTEVGRWNFFKAWPSKWSADDPKADSDDVMIEELTITMERLERVK